MCFLLAYGQLNPNLKKLSLPANEAPQIINSKNVFFFPFFFLKVNIKMILCQCSFNVSGHLCFQSSLISS